MRRRRRSVCAGSEGGNVEKRLLRSLLRRHARTFSLTLSLLPSSLEEPLGVAYLLARASDTVADCAGIPIRLREESLSRLSQFLDAGDPSGWSPSPEGLSPEGAELIRSLPGLLALLEGLSDRLEITDLWGTIVRGQMLDLTRFAPGSPPPSLEELEEYCRLVAGSVGATWTRLVASHAPQSLLRPLGEMTRLAVDYGKGLQMVNILRDRSEDRALGRAYLGETGLDEAAGMARAWLKAGQSYMEGLAPGRIRLASRLPHDLAVKTLRLIEEDPAVGRVKLSRSEVRWTLLEALPSLWLPRGLNPAS